jgi:hypothetical protein
MTHNTQKSKTIRIIQIDPVVNHLRAQEKFFQELEIPIEVFNFPSFELAQPLFENSVQLFDLILLHENLLSIEVKAQLPSKATIAIVNGSRKQFDKLILPQKINHIGQLFKKNWFKQIFNL